MLNKLRGLAAIVGQKIDHPLGDPRELRRLIYQWQHMPGDMIVSDFLACPLAIHSTDFGIVEDVDLAKTDEANPIVSRHFNIPIRDWPDLEKIQMPRITHVAAATDDRFNVMSGICAGLMPVRKVGQTQHRPSSRRRFRE